MAFPAFFSGAELTTLFGGSAIIPNRPYRLSQENIVAQPTDESKTSILPASDLNPLQNPLLGAHMGRWAEVYFTTPPEKRAQAVSDLVRELSNNPMSERISSPSPRNDHGRDDDEPIWGRVEEARSPSSNDIDRKSTRL